MALHYFNQRIKVVEELNRIHGTNFRPEDFYFEDVRAVSSLNPRPTTAANTRATIRVKGSVPAVGQRYAFYNRTDLVYVFQYWPLTTYTALRAWYPKTTHDLLPYMLRQWGLPFEKSDLIDEPLNLVDGAGSVTLRCPLDGPNFVGTITFQVVRGGGSLETELLVKDLTGLPYLDPGVSTAKQSAELYSYRYDFTAHHARLSAAVLGPVPDADMVAWATMLSQVTKHTWVAKFAPANYNIARAEVIYNGLNNKPQGTNPAYKYVMQLRFQSGWCLNLAGVLQLHYNDPLPV